MQIKTAIQNLAKYKIYLKVEKAVNEFLEKKGYLKVGLPVLSPALIPESYLEVFETHFNYLPRRQAGLNNQSKLYLVPSPELFLKRLLTRGIGNCYYLGKSFRNSDPQAALHSPEFTMLEFYKVKADYMDIADVVLEMLQYIKNQISNIKNIFRQAQDPEQSRRTYKKLNIKYQGKKISFDKWEKITVAEAFEKYAGISEEELFDHKLFIKKAGKKGYQTANFNYEDLWSQIYVQEIEKHLGKNGYPTLIYNYPKEFAALAKLNSDGRTTQRFEFYINGIELGDCYTELTDWKEQETRFKIEDLRRKQNKKIAHPIDKGFIEALKYGLPECAGIAIGIERLAMIFANVKSIQELKLIGIS